MNRFRTSVGFAVAMVALLSPEARGQDRYSDVDGAETCRAIWREFGRNMTGRPVAVYCEVRDAGVLPRTEMLQIDGGRRNGIHVRGSVRNDNQVKLVIQAQGRSVEHAKALAAGVSLDLSDRPLRVRGVDTGDERDSRRYVAATILVEVPQQTNLDLSVSYAPLDVENVTGRMELRADHGPIQLNDVGGDVRARVEYGPMTVSLSGAKWQGTGLDAQADYGPVTLRVPRNFSADLEIGTRHGPLDVDFPLTLRRLNGSLIETKLGQGGPRVRAVAQYGPMSLKMQD
jgi:hypothetical protein